MKKRSKTRRNTFLSRDGLRQKWRRELIRRRVDAKGMEPIRQRVHALVARRRARRTQT